MSSVSNLIVQDFMDLIQELVEEYPDDHAAILAAVTGITATNMHHNGITEIPTPYGSLVLNPKVETPTGQLH